MPELKRGFGSLREGCAEFSSRACWFGVYTLPKAIARPFESTIFCWAYSILLGLFLLLSAASCSIFWGDFLRNTLQDVWEKHVGARSLIQGLQWLMSLPGPVILLSLMGWGGLVVLWAGPRRRFLHAIEAQWELPVIRAGGERLDFLKRVNRHLSRGLALGPAAEILPVYVPVPEYQKIK